jgi:hypothetical protein
VGLYMFWRRLRLLVDIHNPLQTGQDRPA